jgi:hypothetical protein
MKLRGVLGLVAIVSTAFFAVHAGTSSATNLCLVQLPECGSGNALPVPETVKAEMTNPYAVFGGQDECEIAKLELQTTSNTGPVKPLRAEVTSLEFQTCGSCPTVTALSRPYEAEFEALKDLPGPTWHGNGSLKIIHPKIELSGCSPGNFTCIDSAGSITLTVTGGSPMVITASSAPLSVVSGPASCGGPSSSFSAEYKVTSPKGKLWLEPDP